MCLYTHCIVTNDLNHYYLSTLVITLEKKGICWVFSLPDPFFILFCPNLCPGSLIFVYSNTKAFMLAGLQLGLTNGKKKKTKQELGVGDIRQVKWLFFSALYFFQQCVTCSICYSTRPHLAWLITPTSHWTPGHWQHCFLPLPCQS